MSIAAQNPPTGGAAPGAPGIPPTWCSSDKEMVGCSLGMSRLWFTIGVGIINEVYFPRVDIPQIRDLGFVVADGNGFWVEVKRLWQHTVESTTSMRSASRSTQAGARRGGRRAARCLRTCQRRVRGLERPIPHR